MGLSGVLVNLGVLLLVERLGPNFHHTIVDLPAVEYNVRWYHVYSTAAFLVANLSNFQLNRMWTFRSAGRTAWRTEYGPFLSVGLIGQASGLALLTSLLHPSSPIALPASMFDGSTTSTVRFYCAQLLVLGMVVPMTFVLNKLWTFAAVRKPWPDQDEINDMEFIAELAQGAVARSPIRGLAASADNVRA